MPMDEVATVQNSPSLTSPTLETGAVTSVQMPFNVGSPPRFVSADDPRKISRRLRVLMVEDDPVDVEMVVQTLRYDGFEVTGDVVQTPEEFTLRIQRGPYDLILADYNLAQWRGAQALDILRNENLDIPLIIVTGASGDEKAVGYIKRGANDYVLKDRMARLPSSVHKALEDKRIREQRDLSEKKLAAKMAELAQSNEELEQFAYVASHDLQEPLRMIANYTQLLAEKYKGKLDEQADKFIAYSVDGAIRLQALIQDLLRLSRLGKGEIDLKITESSEVVEKAVQNLRAAIEESGAVVNCRDLPAVMADRAQLIQVFQNLIANAIKFHGSNTPVIQIDAKRRDHEWLFAVSDNGIGIPAQNWQDVFIIFRRLHDRTQYGGNGIGLSICKKIIERHCGKLWIAVQNTPGTRFEFTLLAEKPSEAHPDRLETVKIGCVEPKPLGSTKVKIPENKVASQPL
jgi:signal transduction histidine kinase